MSKSYFIEFLKRLKTDDDKASLAKLKRAASNPEADFNVYAVLGKSGLNFAEMKPYELRSHILVAVLFAIHPENTDTGNFGNTLRTVRGKISPGEESLDNRFISLLNARSDDLTDKLRHLIRFVSSHEVPVNYGELLYHLQHWDSEEKWVQLSWAKQYWGYSSKEEEEKVEIVENKEKILEI